MERSQVLAYRALRHGFGPEPPDPALLDLGVQDTPVGSAALALSARGLAPDGLTAVWSFRGAPHLHRTADLEALAAALLPRSDADATTRLAALGPALRQAGLSAVDAIRTTAAAVADALAGETAKGELSAAVTERVPEAYSSWCRGCGATHVNELLLRLAALPAGARIVRSTPLTFDRIPRWRVPAEPAGTERLLQAYATLHGPCTGADAAGLLGTTATAVRDLWPAVTQPEVAGDPGPFTRLLAPSDPYLQMRDRALLVPDPAHRKALWTVLAGPGAVVVDGEVAGLWRAKQAGKGRLRLTVTPWRRFHRDGVEAEAARVAAVRGAAAFEIAYEG